MKNLRTILAASLMILLCSASSFGQSAKDTKGLTVQSYMGMYMNGDDIESYDVNEVYNVSFTDGFLTHNILSEGIVTDSQIYKITDIKKSDKDGEMIYSFTAKSGISGKSYIYEISVDGEGSSTLTLTQEDGSATLFLGTTGIYKTYNQF